MNNINDNDALPTPVFGEPAPAAAPVPGPSGQVSGIVGEQRPPNATTTVEGDNGIIPTDVTMNNDENQVDPVTLANIKTEVVDVPPLPLRVIRVNEALKYMAKMRKVFHDKPYICDEFCQILKAFQANRLNALTVITQVSDLLAKNGQPGLIMEFSEFIPGAFKIVPNGAEGEGLSADDANHMMNSVAYGERGSAGSTDSNEEPVKIEQAVEYLDKVKVAFEQVHQPHLFGIFLDIMRAFKAQYLNAAAVTYHVTNLFLTVGHPELIEGFNAFLPIQEKIGDPSQPIVVKRIFLLGHEEVPSSSSSAGGGRQVEQVVEGTASPATTSNTTVKTVAPKITATPAPVSAPPPAPINNGSIPVPSCSNATAPAPAMDASAPSSPPTSIEEALDYLDQVKLAYSENTKVYTDFLDIMKNFKANRIDTSKVIKKVFQLFSSNGRPDLIVGFNEFIPTEFKLPKEVIIFLKNCRVGSIVTTEAGTGEDYNNNDANHEDEEIVDDAATSTASESPLDCDMEDVMDPPPNDCAATITMMNNCGLTAAIPPVSVLPPPPPAPVIASTSTSNERSSFAFTTQPQPISKEMSELPPTSPCSPFELELNRCEDERFECDHILDMTEATMWNFECVLTKMKKMTPEDQQAFRLDDCLGGTSTVINQITIHRMYDKEGTAEEIIESLKNQPYRAVPFVLKRIKKKLGEWREIHNEFKSNWRDRIEKSRVKTLELERPVTRSMETRCLRNRQI